MRIYLKKIIVLTSTFKKKNIDLIKLGIKRNDIKFKANIEN